MVCTILRKLTLDCKKWRSTEAKLTIRIINEWKRSRTSVNQFLEKNDSNHKLIAILIKADLIACFSAGTQDSTLRLRLNLGQLLNYNACIFEKVLVP